MRLTKTQEGIINAELVVGGSVSNVCGATFFPRPFTIERINQTVNTVVRINDALRLRVDLKDKNQWEEEYRWRDYDVIHFSAREEFDAYAETYAKTPLDTVSSLYDARIFTIGEDTGLIYKLHHVICDAWCLSVLRWQLYEILEHDRIPSSGSFLEHCDKERLYFDSKRYPRDRSFFLSQYEKNKEDLVPLEHRISSHAAHSITLELAPDLAAGISHYSAQTGVSPFVILLSAFAVCYSKLHGNAECFYLGTTVLNRTTEAELHTIGPFINDIPLLFSLDNRETVRDTILRVEETVMDSFRHQRFNYPMLQEAIRSQGSPIRLFDILFNYQAEFEVIDEYPVQWYQNGMQLEPLQIHIDHRNDASKLMVTYSYLADLFSGSEIVRLHRHFSNVLRAILSDDQQPISSVSLLDLEERESILKISQGKAVDYPAESVFHLFEKQKTGRIIDGNRQYNLDDLRRDAGKIDIAVRGKKRVIGVLCERSYSELAAIYGIIRGGNAYLPISPEYPAERIRIMLEASCCDTVLAQKKFQSLVANSIAIEDILESPTPMFLPPASAAPDDTLYVIFTSGSTGIPKGAMVSNRSAINRILWMCRAYFDRDTVVMLKTPYTFDVSVWEIFGFALGGFTLYILPPQDHYRQDRVLEHIRRGEVTDLHFVPSVYSHFLDALKKDGGQLPSLKNIFLSGEALPASYVNSSPAAVHNLYGPTECAVDVSYYDCNSNVSDPVPIGKPIDNCQLFVLDQNLQLLPVGATGQICVGGIPVGQGYLNDSERTEKVFVRNPYGPGFLYLTGDLGYWNEDGQLVFVARSDRQVKLNGQRIELGEIEAALSGLVPSSSVIIDGSRLIAFYTGKETTDLRRQLSRVLPRHMIPHAFFHVDAMPLTASGKTDRTALLSLCHQCHQELKPAVLPATQEERVLIGVVREVLSRDAVSTADNFFELGGDSLSSIYVISNLQERGYELEVADLLSCETLADAAGKMRSLDRSSPTASETRQEKPSVIIPLYLPKEEFSSAVVLFSYAGGNEAAYVSLTAEFRRKAARTALYFCPWTDDYAGAAEELRSLSGLYSLTFYSHCAGAVTALKLLDRVNADTPVVSRYVAGASIPPVSPHNIWTDVPDEDLLAVLQKAGMHDLPEKQKEGMVREFRSNTHEFFEYFNSKTEKTRISVSLVLSRRDIFTQNYHEAEQIWEKYVSEVDGMILFDDPTHYFQSSNASELADILLAKGS